MYAYKNPPNPYFEAYLEAWKNYTEAYHSGIDTETGADLYDAYVKARNDFNNSPQTIFNES